MPARIYRNSTRKIVPGVTSVINANLGWNKEALMHWANRQGLEGRHHRDASQEAADIGTIAHAMIEATLKGRDWRESVDLRGVTKEQIARAETAFTAWQEWTETVNFRLVASETSLVSEEHGYGGTLDIAAVKRVTSIVDLKTASGVYPDHLLQLAAYGRLWNEHHPDDPIQAYYLLRLDKVTGGYADHYWPSAALEPAWEAFLCLLRLHNLKRLIA